MVNPTREKRKAKATVYLVRCFRIDRVAERLITTLAAVTGQWPTLVCDERSGEVDAGSCPKISLTSSFLDDLGLNRRPDNWGWFCGDFCYYAAAAAIPAGDRFVMFDADVFLGFDTAKMLVKQLERSPAQAVAQRLGEHRDAQKFSRDLARLGLSPNLGCLFPLTRADRSVIAAMRESRLQAFASGASLNDEAVLAAAVARDGFSSARLETIAPGMFDPESFDSNPPHLYEGLRLRDDLRAFHPVVDAETVLARIGSGQRNYHRHRMRRVLAEASPALRQMILSALQTAETRS